MSFIERLIEIMRLVRKAVKEAKVMSTNKLLSILGIDKDVKKSGEFYIIERHISINKVYVTDLALLQICPRKLWFMKKWNVLDNNIVQIILTKAELRHIAIGEYVHLTVERQLGPDYDVEVTLFDPKTNLVGRIDVIVLDKDGSVKGVIEIKSSMLTDTKPKPHHITQLCGYKYLIEVTPIAKSNDIRFGLVYPTSSFDVTEQLNGKIVPSLVSKAIEILSKDVPPKVEPKPLCKRCGFRVICKKMSEQ